MPQISPWQLGHSSGQRNGKHSFSQLSAVKGDVGEGEREVLMSERASECVGELVTINVEAGDGLMVYLLSRKGGEGELINVKRILLILSSY